MNIQAYQSALNEQQFEAVTYCDGPSLVIAGAGSGKTRVLTYKIAYLLDNGLEPWSILALTFTNKAAKEMNSRIMDICNDINAKGLWSGTFHSIFARILRIEHDTIGYPSDFTIYDATDSKSLIKAIVKEQGYDEKVYKANVVAGRISEAKNHLVTSEVYASDGSILRRDSADGLQNVHKIYTIYQNRLRAAGAMDFDDLLLNTFLMLRDKQEVCERYRKRFQYILVDEYQDTNMLQHRILSLLTTSTSRICVVGDDAQSIYGFRGADITNILNFERQYPTARIIKLECNYRSTETIVEAANSIIKNNQGQIPKNSFSARDKGDSIKVFKATTDKEEAQRVVAHIKGLHAKKQLPYDDMAILYRTNAQSRVLEEALKNEQIPYRIYGGLSFYQRKEVKDVLAYCRLMTNVNDEEAFRRIINYPARGIGMTTLNKIQQAAILNNVSLWQVTAAPQQYGLNFNRGVLGKLSTFCQLIMSFAEMAKTQTASTVMSNIIRQSGIAFDLAQERSAENIARQENVEELLGSVVAFEKDVREAENRPFVSMAEFLSTISLLSDTDEQDDGKPCVTLMTIHAAKGLEFAAVFVTGMEEDLFPNANARLLRKEMEEERRLFYVAVTRAKTYCFLSYADTRYRYGALQFSEPSPFIDEIDQQYLKRTDLEGRSFRAQSIKPSPRPMNDAFWEEVSAPTSTSYPQQHFHKHYERTPKTVAPITPPSNFVSTGINRKEDISNESTGTSAPVAATGLAVGMQVQHERFGKGVVMELQGAGDMAKVKVNFNAVGQKNLLIKYAKLTRI